MAQSAGLHEPEAKLKPETIDRHRAITSVQEELEAIDWYDQRVDASTDAELAAVLAHNRDEEKEHAAMTLEWLRRHDPVLDRHLRTYLFTTAPIIEVEVAAEAESGVEAGAAAAAGGNTTEMTGSLGIGGLKGATP
jgi:ferritin-like protein